MECYPSFPNKLNYSLKIFEDGQNMLVVNIIAETYFGASHALETTFQLAHTNSFLIQDEL